MNATAYNGRMPLRQLVRVTIAMFDGQKLIFRDVTEVDPTNSHDVSRLDESRVRIVTLAHGDVEMDGRLIQTVTVEGDGVGRYFAMTHTGLREVENIQDGGWRSPADNCYCGPDPDYREEWRVERMPEGA